MDIEKIEEALASIIGSFEYAKSDGRGTLASDMLLAMQCQMLVHLYHKLDNMVAILISIDREVSK